MPRIKVAALIITLSFMLVGCSGGQSSAPASNLAAVGNNNGGGTTAAISTDPSVAAFQSGFYAFVNTQGCVECHSSGAQSPYVPTSPFFADANIMTAYTAAKGFQVGSTTAQLINFTDPAGSIFIVQVGNSHCGQTPCQDTAARPMVLTLLTKWATAEIAEYPAEGTAAGPAFKTTGLPVPTTLPLTTATTPAVMRFPLAAVVPSDSALTKAILEVSIELYDSTGNEYRVFNPRIAGNTAAVAIQGIHVYINPSTNTSGGVGTEDALQGSFWDTLALTAAVVALPSPLPTGPMATATPMTTTPLGIAVQSTSDVMTLGFDSIH